MKKNAFKTAFTLIELIVAMVLLSFIVLGIYSINSVLSSNHQDYGQKYLIKSETQTTLNHILNNASLAVGSGTADSNGYYDQGILLGAGAPPTVGESPITNGAGDANSFCIHQAGTNTTGGQNIINSATDIWLCYTWYPAASANAYQIYWCTSTYTTPGTAAPPASAPYRGAAAPCSAASANYTFLGTAYSVSNSIVGGTTPYYSPLTNPTTGFTITIQNCLNDSVATCNAGATPGTSSDPVNNPEVQLFGSVTPAQEGT